MLRGTPESSRRAPQHQGGAVYWGSNPPALMLDRNVSKAAASKVSVAASRFLVSRTAAHVVDRATSTQFWPPSLRDDLRQRAPVRSGVIILHSPYPAR